MIAALLIGNELLSGQIEEQNLKYMLKSFAVTGHQLSEVRWVGDELNSISRAFSELSKNHQFVISSGGVGPTHDDVTIEALANAFNEKLVINDFLKDSLKNFYGDKFNQAAIRMAMVPESAELVDKMGSNWPILCVKNCFILPGVPQIFRQKFDRLIKILPETRPYFIGRFHLNADEVFFADELRSIQDQHPDILIGSYPIFGNPDYRTEITIKHNEKERLDSLFLMLEEFFSTRKFLVRTFITEKYEPKRS
ncbi:MAG: competence/damage-inducible protein A [Calditrichaeota bacterium]|nr:competence/damage-inducible protein A [Calditrichota bacterium]